MICQWFENTQRERANGLRILRERERETERQRDRERDRADSKKTQEERTDNIFINTSHFLIFVDKS